jgi:RHH-type transcriptional regulator, proline utilization regulon repressor / proline dehydrogenase / delta 1-pyrroline-5-carboxylate dehydrogenase
MISTTLPKRGYLRNLVNDAYRMDEAQCLARLLQETDISEDEISRIHDTAQDLIRTIRDQKTKGTGLDTFLNEYDLSSEEGIALMCLAEALLRVPDKDNIDRLIRDKLGNADWYAHVNQSDSLTVNAATWALMLTGKVLTKSDGNIITRSLKRVVTRTGEPVIRNAVARAMRIMSQQFVMGRTIEEAMTRGAKDEARGYRYSYDMLGEAAHTAADAERYFESYCQAITTVGSKATGTTLDDRPGISIKLSALHPRYEANQYPRVIEELTPKVLHLAILAKQANVQLTMDAEEADRLDLSLDIFEKVQLDQSLAGWDGFGLALQSYQKRGWYLIDWVADLANRSQHKIRVRLIKGAYWDTEIKQSQMLGLHDYPVFTRKNTTDVSFIACVKKLLDYPDQIAPQFATHNAYSVACVLELLGDRRDYEFQALHGMGQSLYDQIVGPTKKNIPCRIYAPVGGHEELLPYLVRRLLENGVNTSFVHHLVNKHLPIDELIKDPFTVAQAYVTATHPKIPLPSTIFAPRENSAGIDFSDHNILRQLTTAFKPYTTKTWHGGPIIGGKLYLEDAQATYSPQTGVEIGKTSLADEAQLETALSKAQAAFQAWDQQGFNARADILDRVADLYTEHQHELMAILIKEAGKTVIDAHDELREAVDFCRYYAAQARLATPVNLKGYTGETNQLTYHGRGVMACISPWNFPLAIFTGQIMAALAAGNCVIAKPAEPTLLLATAAIKLCHQAGIPGAVLQLVPGPGRVLGAKLTADPRCRGILFTGSTETARQINQTIATKPGEIIPFIAETGGQNAMIVDSSALPEQVILDLIQSAFGSAGQRCSACRVLFIQSDVAPRILTMLRGAMAELTIADPSLITTDIGPVINQQARQQLLEHVTLLQQNAELIYACELPEQCQQGTFVAPQAYKIPNLEFLTGEVFGPILHVIEYKRSELDDVIDSINRTGFGLTLGIHSRIDATIDYIRTRVNVGNYYVNRNMIGAVVGVQPFGGEGLSGTGPKAGGPNYVLRLCRERVTTINTTAAGGNASLMSLSAVE